VEVLAIASHVYERGMSMVYEVEEARFLSSMDPVCSAEELELVSGWARGSRLIRVRNDRVEFDVLPDRGMNLGNLAFRALPLAWLSSVGYAAPGFYEPEGMGWLRTFSGGALVTCGLTQAGDPCTDEGESLGLHGRISSVPARDVSVQRGWEGTDYVIRVHGTMHQARVFGEFLELERTIVTTYGKPIIRIHDVIANRGYVSSPLMVLYHMNFGYPLVSPEARMLFPSRHVHPYDRAASTRLDLHTIPAEPAPGYPEHVYYHELSANSGGRTVAAIVNGTLDGGLGVSVEWNLATLPRFAQWNMFAAGQYTVGLEPANCLPEGRKPEKDRGTLEYLEPGASKVIDVDIAIVQGVDHIRELEERVRALLVS
jgi:hypothetical protein